MNNEGLIKLVNSTESELYERIGMELNSDRKHIFGEKELSVKELISKGKKWFAFHKNEIKLLVCNNESVLLLLDAPNSDKNERKILLISAVADLISSICLNLSPFTVAALVLIVGMEELCGS